MKHFKTTDEKAIGFWTIVTNILLVLFTFWLGIVVQSIVAQKNASVSSTLANMEYVEKVKPLVDSLNIKYGPMLMEFTSIPSGKDSKGKPVFLESDNSKGLAHYDKYNSLYADFFNDLAYTFAKIYKFDHNCPAVILTTAQTLPILSPMIKSVSTFTDTSLSQTIQSKNNWLSLRDTIRGVFRQPSYIQAFGIVLGNTDEALPIVKQLYDESIKTPDAKSKLIMAAETYALSVYAWISSHNYYNPPKDTSLIGRIADNPIPSLIVILVLGLIATWIIYSLHSWSSPTVKESDSHLKKIASNIEEMRKDTSLYRRSLEKSINTMEINVNSIHEEMEIMATPIYDKLYEQEQKYIQLMIETIQASVGADDMPQFNEDKSLFGKNRYVAISNYSKRLEAYMRNIGLSVPEK